MNKDDFKTFLRKLSDYYGLEKIVSPQRFTLWYDRVKNIPTETLEDIADRFFQEKESIPRNIPKWMKEYFRQWLSSNPAKLHHQEKIPCNECGSHGLIHYADDRGQYRVWRMARCPYCENWKRHIGVNAMKLMPVRTVQDLQESGHTVMKRKLAR